MSDATCNAQITEDRFAAVVLLFLDSAKFKAYSDGTQDTWGRALRYMIEPGKLGDLSRQLIRPALVQAFFDGLEGHPGKQETALSVLKQLEKWAIVRDYLPRAVTTGVEIEETDGGHIPWTEEQVSYAEQRARADIAKAITLGANTGQRGSDLIRMGWADIQTFEGEDGIRVTQKKTGRDVWVPITAPLAAAMKTWDRLPGPFLRRPDGGLWKRHDLTMAWTNHRDGVRAFEHFRLVGPEKDRPLVLHGLRGHACVRLKRAGANTLQIADMVGMSEEMVKNYTRFSSQQENASAALYHLKEHDRTRGERARGLSIRNAS